MSTHTAYRLYNSSLISAETARQAYLNVDNLGDVLKLIPYTSCEHVESLCHAIANDIHNLFIDLYDHIPSKLVSMIPFLPQRNLIKPAITLVNQYGRISSTTRKGIPVNAIYFHAESNPDSADTIIILTGPLRFPPSREDGRNLDRL